MKDKHSPESFLRSMETLVEATRSYQAVVDALEHNTDLFLSTRGRFQYRLVKQKKTKYRNNA